MSSVSTFCSGKVAGCGFTSTFHVAGSTFSALVCVCNVSMISASNSWPANWPRYWTRSFVSVGFVPNQ